LVDIASRETTVSNGNDWGSGDNGQGGNDWQQNSGQQNSGQQGSGQPSNSPGGGQQFGPQGGSGGAQPPGGGQFGATNTGGQGAGGGQGGPGGGGGQGGGGGGGFQPPGGGPPTDLVTEGWGGGPEVTTDEVVERLKLVFARAKGSILKAWLGIAAVLLVFEMLQASLRVVSYFLDNIAVSAALGTIGMVIGLIAWVVGIGASAMQLSLLKPLHRAIFEGAHAVGGPKEVLQEAAGVFVPVFLAMLLVSVSSLGLLCCIVPGLFLLFVFCQAPYLAATQGLDPIAALKRSFYLNKTYWMVILAAFAAMLVVGLIAGCFLGVSNAVLGWMSSFLRPFNWIVLSGLTWVFLQFFMFGVLLVHASIFSTIESKETGKMPA
jgi:hypothetical protein